MERAPPRPPGNGARAEEWGQGFSWLPEPGRSAFRRAPAAPRPAVSPRRPQWIPEALPHSWVAGQGQEFDPGGAGCGSSRFGVPGHRKPRSRGCQSKQNSTADLVQFELHTKQVNFLDTSLQNTEDGKRAMTAPTLACWKTLFLNCIPARVISLTSCLLSNDKVYGIRPGPACFIPLPTTKKVLFKLFTFLWALKR